MSISETIKADPETPISSFNFASNGSGLLTNFDVNVMPTSALLFLLASFNMNVLCTSNF